MTNRPPEPPRVSWTFDPPPDPVHWRIVGEDEWHEAVDGRLPADLPANVTIEWRAGLATGRARYSPWPEPVTIPAPRRRWWSRLAARLLGDAS